MYHTLEGFTVVYRETWVLAKNYEICTPTKVMAYVTIFLKEMEYISLFCGATYTPVLDCW